MAISFSQSCIISWKEDVVEMDVDIVLTETKNNLKGKIEKN